MSGALSDRDNEVCRRQQRVQIAPLDDAADQLLTLLLRHLVHQRRPQHLHLLVEAGTFDFDRSGESIRSMRSLGIGAAHRAPQRARAGGQATYSYATMRWCATLIRCGFIGWPNP